MECLHAWLSSNAIQLLQGKRGIPNRRRDPSNKAVGKGCVSFNGCVIHDLRKVHTLFRRCPLPRRSAVEGQDVHLDPMLIHPFASFVEIEI